MSEADAYHCSLCGEDLPLSQETVVHMLDHREACNRSFTLICGEGQVWRDAVREWEEGKR